jgi:N-acetylneuraminate synthase
MAGGPHFNELTNKKEYKMYKQPMLIAEVGCNHMGDIDIAKEFIDTAKDFCNVKYIKFQKRYNKELLPIEQYNTPHPNPQNSYGETYGLHREYLEFNVEIHQELKNYCDALDMTYSTSVWDITSAKEICLINPEFIKIPSATNTHTELLKFLCDNYVGQIHISLGMTTMEEESNIIQLFTDHNRLKDLVIYACTSGYPVPFADLNLLEVKRIKKAYSSLVHGIGFSGHHNGIAVDMAAYTLGATYIERHFTLDRTWKGTDHAALEPDGFRRLSRDLDHLYEALHYKEKEILDIEIPQREKLKWSQGE